METFIFRCEIQELGHWEQAKLSLDSVGYRLAILWEFVYPYLGGRRDPVVTFGRMIHPVMFRRLFLASLECRWAVRRGHQVLCCALQASTSTGRRTRP